MNRTAILRFTVVAGLVMAGAGAGINMGGRTQPKESPLRLVLNVPAHRLYVFENGKNTRVFKVSVGMVGHQTPAGTYQINQSIWNPWWHPPASPWAEGRKPEPPGENNPMGRVKLNFAPLLYIHGTNDRVALGDPASHGCVRLMNDDLIELARTVQKYATPGIKQPVLDELAANPEETREFNFRSTVPFEVIYNVASVQNDFLYVYPDVYGKIKPAEYHAQVRDALADNGIDIEDVDQARLEGLLLKGRASRVSISLAELRGVPAASATTASRNR
ncbi:MAG: L,D-transpeptidase [Longimicrobiales bacterium]